MPAMDWVKRHETVGGGGGWGDVGGSFSRSALQAQEESSSGDQAWEGVQNHQVTHREPSERDLGQVLRPLNPRESSYWPQDQVLC